MALLHKYHGSACKGCLAWRQIQALLGWTELSRWIIHFPFTVRPDLIRAWLLLLRQAEVWAEVTLWWPAGQCDSLVCLASANSALTGFWHFWPGRWARWTALALQTLEGWPRRPHKSQANPFSEQLALGLAQMMIKVHHAPTRCCRAQQTVRAWQRRAGGLQGFPGLCHPVWGRMIRWLCSMCSHYTAGFSSSIIQRLHPGFFPPASFPARNTTSGSSGTVSLTLWSPDRASLLSNEAHEGCQGLVNLEGGVCPGSCLPAWARPMVSGTFLEIQPWIQKCHFIHEFILWLLNIYSWEWSLCIESLFLSHLHHFLTMQKPRQLFQAKCHSTIYLGCKRLSLKQCCSDFRAANCKYSHPKWLSRIAM